MLYSPFFTEDSITQKELQVKKDKILTNPLLAGNLISTDSTVTVINIVLPLFIRGSADAAQVIDKIKKMTVFNKPESAEVFLTGLSPMFSDTLASVGKDFKTFFILTWVIMAGFLFLAFRTVRGVVLPLGVTVLTVVWVLGLMAVTGQKISVVGAMLPSLVGIICFSDAVHLLTYYDEQARVSRDKRDIALKTMQHMLTTCFLTSFTTSMAFGTLVCANISSIRQFGLWVAIGIMLGYVLIIVLIPIMLYILPLPKQTGKKPFELSIGGRALSSIYLLTQYGKRWIPLTAILLIVISCTAALNLKVETSITAFLPDSSPSMKGIEVLRGKLAGFGKVEVLLEGEDGVFENPWALQELQKITRYLEEQAEIQSTFSINKLLQWTYQVSEETDTDLLKDPDAEGLLAEYFFMLSNLSSQQNSFITEDSGSVRLVARLNATGAGEQVGLQDSLEAYLQQNLDSRLDYQVTGESGRIAKQIGSIVESLLSSLGLTLIVIACLMLWLMKSLKMAVFVMIPNILPVAMTLGLMGLLGIKLNFATIMITSIVIGIAVDDTIHFIMRYFREIEKNRTPVQAVEQAFLHSGRAIVLTSVVIASGCSIFALSDFIPSRQFGLLMAFAMLTALLADLLVLPYFLRLWQPKGGR